MPLVPPTFPFDINMMHFNIFVFIIIYHFCPYLYLPLMHSYFLQLTSSPNKNKIRLKKKGNCNTTTSLKKSLNSTKKSEITKIFLQD